MYLVVNCQKLDGTTAQSVFMRDSLNQARSDYHQTLASNYVALEAPDNALSGFITCVIDARGISILQESVDME